MASEEPVVAVPIADLADGACHRSARIDTPVMSGQNLNYSDIREHPTARVDDL